MQTSGFFDESRPWSGIKWRILEKYLDAYFRKRGSSHSKIFYLDAFAGAGIYAKGTAQEELGSPVRLANLAVEWRVQGRQGELICLNIEESRSRCRDLKLALEDYDPESVRTFCGPFQSHLDEVLKITFGYPMVSFLDPFGVVGISVEELRPLLERPDTEIFLNLSTPTMSRLKGFANSDAIEAKGKRRRLSITLGEDPDDPDPTWLQKMNNLSGSDWSDWAVDQYLQQLKSASPYLQYGVTYPVRTAWSGGTKYHLVFASRSLEPFPLLTDFVCTEEDDLSLQEEIRNRPVGQLSMFSPVHVTRREERYRDVMTEMVTYVQKNPGCTRNELIRDFAFSHFGEFRQKDFRFMVSQLLREGAIRRGDGPVADAPLYRD